MTPKRSRIATHSPLLPPQVGLTQDTPIFFGREFQ